MSLLAERLRAIADTLPGDASVLLPIATLREWLADEPAGDCIAPNVAAAVDVDLTVAEVRGLFKRGASTIREWCERGELPGAYRNRGREWRIPRSAIEAMQRAEAERHRAVSSADPSSEEATELSSWRRHMPARRRGT